MDAQPSTHESELQALVDRSGGFQPWRRVFHMACGLFVVGTLLVLDLSRREGLLLLGTILGAQLLMDAVRLSSTRANILFFRLLPALVTPRERTRIASSTWFNLGAIASLALFPRPAAIGGVLVLAFADPAANVVGRRWGKIPLGKNGTVEGTAAFLLVAFGVLLLVAPPLPAIGAALFASAVERTVRGVDDNFTIPVATAAALRALGVV